MSRVTGADVLSLVPNRDFGAARVCDRGAGCVAAAACGAPAVLSRFNPRSSCYCCQARERDDRRERPVSTAELMAQRTGIAA